VKEALEQLDQQHSATLAALVQESNETKASRESDLQIIERALAAGHENQQQVRNTSRRMTRVAADCTASSAKSSAEANLWNVLGH
jgi:hypothetical protein